LKGQISLDEGAVSYQRFGDLDSCNDSWNKVAGGETYLSSGYLELLQTSIPGLKPQYYLLNEGEETIGIVYFQEYPFVAIQSFNSFKSDDATGLTKLLRRIVSSLVSFNAVANGNMILTGPYGFAFVETVPLAKQLKILTHIFELAIAETRKRTKISLHFLKELTEDQDALRGPWFEQSKFYRFTVQPTMHFQVRPEWSTMDDYLQAIKSKYRVRYRKARKRVLPIVKKRLLPAEILEHEDTIHRLYKQVIDQSSFNLMEVDRKYFGNLAELLGDRFTLNAYFNGDKLIGYMSFIDTPDVLEAHFTGIDQEENRNFDLYLNMLFDLVEEAISRQKKILNLSRTALEIKSSIGATPVSMYCYLRHQNPALNSLLPMIFRFLYKEDEWVQRIPFKDESGT